MFPPTPRQRYAQRQVSGLAVPCRAVPAVIGFVGAPHLSPLIQKGLNSGICGGCNSTLRTQKKFEMTREKLFPLAGGRARLPALLMPGHGCKDRIGRWQGMSWGGSGPAGFQWSLGCWGTTRGPLPVAF